MIMSTGIINVAPKLITLMTDFGISDSYVGVMRGVIKSIMPSADIVDVTHHIPRHDIRAGSLVWRRSAFYFPPRTIHLGVVDPGVGTDRNPIVAEIGDHFFVCPDNGLISQVAPGRTLRAFLLENSDLRLRSVSHTFHGRDIFAPAAAHLAAGVPIEQFGRTVETPLLLPVPTPVIEADQVLAHIVSFDQFGNAATDLSSEEFHAWTANPEVAVTIERIGLVIDGIAATYGSVPAADVAALFASDGYLEISVNGGDARLELGLTIGDAIAIRRSASS